MNFHRQCYLDVIKLRFQCFLIFLFNCVWMFSLMRSNENSCGYCFEHNFSYVQTCCWMASDRQKNPNWKLNKNNVWWDCHLITSNKVFERNWKGRLKSIEKAFWWHPNNIADENSFPNLDAAQFSLRRTSGKFTSDYIRWNSNSYQDLSKNTLRSAQYCFST